MEEVGIRGGHVEKVNPLVLRDDPWVSCSCALRGQDPPPPAATHLGCL